MKEFVISYREAGQRVDKYLLRLLPEASKGFVYKMLRKKNIVLNGGKAAGSELLKEGDEVRLYLSDETFLKFAPAFAAAKGAPMGTAEGAGVKVVYEDDDILIINKPAGLLSQKAKEGDDSANDRIIFYLLESGQITEEELRIFRPSICNRLDRNTSGLLIAGKSMKGLKETAAMLKDRTIQKYYRALAAGRVKEEARLRGRLLKDERTNTVRISDEDTAEGGELIETEYRPLGYFGEATLLEVHLVTGRSHQIRAHLASVGHPVLGDPKYGDAALNRELREAAGIRAQLLCACRMEFPDGRAVTVPEPEEFARAEKYLGGGR